MKKHILLPLLAVFALPSFADNEAIIAKYNASCGVCHVSGVAGAPKTGVVDDWTVRLEKGMDVLVASVTNGLNAMPPKGMCKDCTAEDYQWLIEYMSKAP